MAGEQGGPVKKGEAPSPPGVVDWFDAALALVLILACGLLYYTLITQLGGESKGHIHQSWRA